MSVISIKIRESPRVYASKIPITLNGIRVILDIRHYADRWYLRTLDEAAVQICGPDKIVPGIDLWRAYRYDSRIPAGELFCYSIDREPPTLDSADKRSFLYYREATA
jgi:hypothetical protein